MIESGNDQNYATIGCMIMQRGDDEPVPAFRARARNTALEVGADILILEKLEWVWVDDLEIVEVDGGLDDDASADFATVGDRRIDRGACEDVA